MSEQENDTITTDQEQLSRGEKETDVDLVNHPPHYTSGSVETIDLIAEIVSPYKEPMKAFLVGQVIKYLSRAPHKEGIIDIKKAQWYLNKLVEEYEG